MDEKTPQAEVVETVRAFFEAWTTADVEAAAEGATALLTEPFTGIGTGPGDYYPDRAAMRALLYAEKAAASEWDTTTYDLAWLHVRLLRPDLALVECQIRSEVSAGGEVHLVEPRCSMVLDRSAGRWLIGHFHFSMPDATAEVGDTLIDALERKTRVLEREVAERTAELEASLADLRAAQARLVQQEKMASLGALTAGIAHEIKNPLNFVTGFADLSAELLDDLDGEADPDERAALQADLRANVEKIGGHGRRADAIVRSMMAHARSGSGERRAVDVNALVEEHATHALHAERAQHPNAEPCLTLDLDAAAGSVDADPQEIGRVVVNLIDNALAAVRQRAGEGAEGYDPTVTVSTRRAEGGPGARPGLAVEIRVADNGPGMAEAVRSRVFEPFFTTKPPGEGTGLGLSLSHDVVVQGHGGTLAVESAPGEGATFVVRLPARGHRGPA